MIIRGKPSYHSKIGMVGLFRRELSEAELLNQDLFLVVHTDPFSGLRHTHPLSASVLDSTSREGETFLVVKSIIDNGLLLIDIDRLIN